MNTDGLKGMTVNERLFSLGLMNKFDEAIKSQSKEEAISVLEKAQFSKKQATETVAAIFESPKKYGY